MRLASLKVSGFRGFAEARTFKLDADAIIVVGANGQGKTSFFDAILWGLCGRVPRLGSDDSRLLSVYAEGGQARVEVGLRDVASDEEVRVTRSFDGVERRVSLETGDKKFQGPSAEVQIIDRIWSDAALATDPGEALASVLTRGVYLQQDLIRQFVEAATDQERFSAVSELMGAGRVTELQTNLERSKKTWSTATNQREQEIGPMRERLAVVVSRLSELEGQASREGPAITSGEWGKWWNDLGALGVITTRVEAGSRDASRAIDDAMKQIEMLRRSAERRLQSARSLQEEMGRLAKSITPEVAPIRERLSKLRNEVREQKDLVDAEQARLAEARRLQTALKEEREQLRALATIALQHLGERCPVCGQEYDQAATKQRLEEMSKETAGHRDVDTLPERLPQLLAALEAKEKAAGGAEVDLASAERLVSERRVAEESLAKRLAELKIEGKNRQGQLAETERIALDTDSLITKLAELRRTGESLALRLAQSSAAAAIQELQQEAEKLRLDITTREKDVARRQGTCELAQRIIEALREAASGVVEERLREIEPLLQNIYSRIDPHPTFRLVTFLSRIVRGRGRLATVVSDPIDSKESDIPLTILSSSQVNALAVSVFLALNMGVRRPPLSVALLDDPLQSLDDINLLGLVDLLRRAMVRRQLCISTHDVRFGNLLARKLRPTGNDGHTMVIEMDGWNRRGPLVQTREVKGDPVPLRLVAARA